MFVILLITMPDKASPLNHCMGVECHILYGFQIYGIPTKTDYIVSPPVLANLGLNKIFPRKLLSSRAIKALVKNVLHTSLYEHVRGGVNTGAMISCLVKRRSVHLGD